ncbi:MAG: right-handed parallel beta-helix repeat-containing protein [Bacteroides sp.]|nr:right-handed parallel beta-helix repeat-containing protein [Bacteroides sp.]MCM1378953.1 right-handed parallel beta-helix repeat-containing protein [Bacteroides sp.]MCM1445569.1 right-handed parallel beta-helix repeat-containing protein [Prevotella sp.]
MKSYLLYVIYCLLSTVCALGLGSCIVDSFDTSPSAQPTFSVDEAGLDMGLYFADTPSPTSYMMVYNPNKKIINLSEIRLRSGEHFRINVDGRSGEVFNDVEIRPNDSIYVFVECTLPKFDDPEPQEVADYLDVTTNGVLKSVKICAQSQNVNRIERLTIDSDFRLQAAVPNLIYDTLRVSPGATLTIEPGAKLLFHDKAALIVEGTLLSLGTAEQPIELRGDRTNNVVADISFEVMSNQWEGVRFTATSAGNRLENTSIINTCQGVTIDSIADLTLINSRLYNSGLRQLTAGDKSSVTALGCEISNAASCLAYLGAGTFIFDRCTLANWYLFEWPDLSIVEFTDPANTSATFSNSVIYGRDRAICKYDDVEEVDLWFRRCMFAMEGSDDERYLNCLWDADPLLDYSLTEYTFSYFPLDGSPVLEAAMAEYDHPDLPPADRYGRDRGLTLGAYAPEQQ